MRKRDEKKERNPSIPKPHRRHPCCQERRENKRRCGQLERAGKKSKEIEKRKLRAVARKTEKKLKEKREGLKQN